ncbi:MAG: hypothetical protein NTV68_07605 [Methanomicrobiales archaeon]|nr:hypothetical protein [Methanomicrobiales archaeon]
MAPQAEGEGMRERKSTLTLTEAMVVARERSRLEKWHARYKCYYDNNHNKMRKKNSVYYQEHRDAIRARSRLSSERRRVNTVINGPWSKVKIKLAIF